MVFHVDNNKALQTEQWLFSSLSSKKVTLWGVSALLYIAGILCLCFGLWFGVLFFIAATAFIIIIVGEKYKFERALDMFRTRRMSDIVIEDNQLGYSYITIHNAGTYTYVYRHYYFIDLSKPFLVEKDRKLPIWRISGDEILSNTMPQESNVAFNIGSTLGDIRNLNAMLPITEVYIPDIFVEDIQMVLQNR